MTTPTRPTEQRLDLPFGHIVPNWPVPSNVCALISTRQGGFSRAPFDGFNLGAHVDDDPGHVAANRALLARAVPSAPAWLEQVHGTTIVDAGEPDEAPPRADGAITARPGIVCAVLTADCLPVLLADSSGTAVGIAHAGWRGLAGGVVEAAVAAMRVSPERVIAYLGPAISGAEYEVGGEVREAFVGKSASADAAFLPRSGGKYLCNLYALARMRLAAVGVKQVFGGGYCVYRDRARFFSYRRERVTGRMASLIWMR